MEIKENQVSELKKIISEVLKISPDQIKMILILYWIWEQIL